MSRKRKRSEFGMEFADIGYSSVPVLGYEYTQLDEGAPIEEYRMLTWESRGKQLKQRSDVEDVEPLVRASDVNAVLKREFDDSDLPPPDYDKLVLDTVREYGDELSEEAVAELRELITEEGEHR